MRNKQTTARTNTKKRNLGRYKSSLEKTCADLLRDSGLDFEYESREYVVFEPFKYTGTYWKMTSKSKDMTNKSGKGVFPIKYTPDFVCPNETWIIETKGYNRSHHDFPMRWKLFMKHLMEDTISPPSLFICKNKAQIEYAIRIIKDEQGIS